MPVPVVLTAVNTLLETTSDELQPQKFIDPAYVRFGIDTVVTDPVLVVYIPPGHDVSDGIMMLVSTPSS